MTAVQDRVDTLDWSAIAAALDEGGVSATGPVLHADECARLADLYTRDECFRSTIDMAGHRFGQGEYRYFSYPLPGVVADLRDAFWPHLLPIAREWAARRDLPSPWPDDLDEWLEQCHSAGQHRPTPLLLRYGAGDWNALHRDIYGELVFPLQVTIGLDDPGTSFTGGEFVVVEQRPRAQSRATVIELPRGHGVVFTTRERPVRSSNGWSSAPMRHGVSTVRSGQRTTLGVIFHDAT